MATHHPAVQTSPVISTLVENGATCVGKTVINEMAFGYAVVFVFHVSY
jgi:Asp-tRNA(Asn)/Glu-tRNA(Gln) amidotransferase A subunit family amidase